MEKDWSWDIIIDEGIPGQHWQIIVLTNLIIGLLLPE